MKENLPKIESNMLPHIDSVRLHTSRRWSYIGSWCAAFPTSSASKLLHTEVAEANAELHTVLGHWVILFFLLFFPTCLHLFPQNKYTVALGLVSTRPYFQSTCVFFHLFSMRRVHVTTTEKVSALHYFFVAALGTSSWKVLKFSERRCSHLCHYLSDNQSPWSDWGLTAGASPQLSSSRDSRLQEQASSGWFNSWWKQCQINKK